MADLPEGKRTINKSKSEQRVNLKSLLGRTPTQREKIAFVELAIDTIENRTLDGVDIDRKKFRQYSAEYAEKKGVTRDSVDLFLTGDMLDSIDPISQTTNTVTFGIEGGTAALKSDNHNKGVTLPKREFFGITQNEAERIAAEIREEPTDTSFTLGELRAALALLDIEAGRIMAKLRIKNLRQVQTAIRKEITKGLRDPEIRKGVGEIVVEEIQANPVPVTSKVTKAWRKYLEQGNKTDSKYRRSQINITFTGELLEDLKNNVKARFGGGKAEYVIEQSNKKHRKYKSPSGKPLKGARQSYKNISEFIIKKGYNYLTFSSKSKKRVINFIRERLFKNLGK